MIFRDALIEILEAEGSASQTPSSVTADYLLNCLAAFDAAVNRRAAEIEQLRREGME